MKKRFTEQQMLRYCRKGKPVCGQRDMSQAQHFGCHVLHLA